MTPAPWSALSGVFTVQVDEPLCELGRAIYHGMEPAESYSSDGLTVVERKLFSFIASPWRFAYVNMIVDEDHPVGACADDLTPESRDHLGIRAMLDPSSLSTIIDLPSAGRFRVPGPPVEEVLFLVPGLVTLSADHYEAERHEELGILTSWRAVIRGVVAEVMTLEPTWYE
jgi:hypothetical protein